MTAALWPAHLGESATRKGAPSTRERDQPRPQRVLTVRTHLKNLRGRKLSAMRLVHPDEDETRLTVDAPDVFKLTAQLLPHAEFEPVQTGCRHSTFHNSTCAAFSIASFSLSSASGVITFLGFVCFGSSIVSVCQIPSHTSWRRW